GIGKGTPRNRLTSVVIKAHRRQPRRLHLRRELVTDVTWLERLTPPVREHVLTRLTVIQDLAGPMLPQQNNRLRIQRQRPETGGALGLTRMQDPTVLDQLLPNMQEPFLQINIDP